MTSKLPDSAANPHRQLPSVDALLQVMGDELERWIKPGDEVELEVEGIGVLKNRIGQRQTNFRDKKNA